MAKSNCFARMHRSFAMSRGLLVLALLVCATQASAGLLWGTTNGTGDSGVWTGGEIFTVDPDTGTVDVKNTWSNGLIAFGDIAVGSSGVYVTYAPSFSDGFNRLAKVNTATFAFDWTQTLSTQVNALTFVDDTLYLAAGGGSVDGLYSLDVLDGLTTPTSIGPSGFLGSDGDLFYDSVTSTMYNVYTPVNIGNLVSVDLTTGAGTAVGTLNSTAKFGTTNGGDNYGWAGMDFDSNGKLWAGTYWDKMLYSRSDLLAGSGVTLEYNLSSQIGGTITGLSYAPAAEVPLPGTLALLALGIAGIGWRFRNAVARR